VSVKGGALDLSLFLRPFTTEAWIAIAVVFPFLLVPYLTTKYMARIPWCKNMNPTSRRISLYVSWTFFLLLNCYYGGALTMFFTSRQPAPFISVQQGLRMFPTWKMIIVKGYSALE
jgi:hypothetical protein